MARSATRSLQPGKDDSGDFDSNLVGKLLRSYIGVAGDCAISTVTGRFLNGTILGLDVEPKRVGRPNLEDLVVKSGRTTGITFGIVKAVGVPISLKYSDGTVHEITAFEIRPNPDKPPILPSREISDGGDSGAIWMVDSTSEDADIALGLQFAGEELPAYKHEHALACYLHSVFEKLEISFKKPH